jgi:hypothetical protein
MFLPGEEEGGKSSNTERKGNYIFINILPVESDLLGA